MLFSEELKKWAEAKADGTVEPSASTSRTRDKAAGMISEVAPRLFVGNIQAAKSRELLAANNISSIVNVGGGWAAVGSRSCTRLKLRTSRGERPTVLIEVDGHESSERWLESEVLFLTVKDREEESLLPFLGLTSEYIHARLQPRRGFDSPGVLVHCRAGHHRSPVIAAAYLSKHRGLSPDDARIVVKLGRPIADFTEWHTMQLDTFGSASVVD